MFLASIIEHALNVSGCRNVILINAVYLFLPCSIIHVRERSFLTEINRIAELKHDPGTDMEIVFDFIPALNSIFVSLTLLQRNQLFGPDVALPDASCD